MNARIYNTSGSDKNIPDNPKPDTLKQEPLPEGHVVLPSSGQVDVGYQQAPTLPPEDKKIHSRRPLPLVPERSPKDP